jgi:hypothetical protein
MMRLMSGGRAKAVDVQDTPLVLTCTTTGAQTLTFTAMTVAAGKTVVVDWGDTNTNTYTAGAGTRTHAYAGAGTWTVKLANRRNITELSLNDAKITALLINSTNPLPSGLTYLNLNGLAGLTYNANTNPLPSGLTYLYLNGLTGLTYNANTNPLPSGLTYLTLNGLTGLTYNANTNPLPSGLTYLNLYNLAGLTYNANTNPLPSGLTSLTLTTLAGLTYNANTNPLPSGLTYLNLINLAGLTYNANTNPLPSGLTYLYLYNLAGLTWIINALQPWPTGATAAIITGCPLVTCVVWTDNAIQSIQAENAYSAMNVYSWLAAILANKTNFTYATPTLDLLGGSNAAPNGTYRAADPVTSGAEAKYALVNGNGSYAPGPEWVVQTA